jgi:acetyltransferase-like isoleucine patch superfamily enzyme
MTEGYHKFGPKIALSAKVIGENVKIGPLSIVEDYVCLESGLHDKSQIWIGSRCKIKQGVVMRTYGGEIRISDRVSIGEYSVLAAHSKLTIGSCTIIAAHCYLSAANHIFADDGIIRFQGETTRGINIGDSCWIGGNTMILDGVDIGDGCVVGAGSVVTKSLPAHTLCHGNPCHVVRKREPFPRTEDVTK